MPSGLSLSGLSGYALHLSYLYLSFSSLSISVYLSFSVVMSFVRAGPAAGPEKHKRVWEY